MGDELDKLGIKQQTEKIIVKDSFDNEMIGKDGKPLKATNRYRDISVESLADHLCEYL